MAAQVQNTASCAELNRLIVSCAIGMTAGLPAGPATAQSLRCELVATAPSPLYVTHAPGDYSRAFIVGRTGVISILHLPANTLDPDPFITFTDVSSGVEQGMYGMAFHPDYDANGYVYFDYTEAGTGNILVVRYTRSATDPDRLDPATRHLVLRLVRDPGIHNGGWIDFGPDGYLYVSVGDGNLTLNAQLLDNPWGKMHRIDVDGDDFPDDPDRNFAVPPANPWVGMTDWPSIWARGLRNPYRCCFDSQTGALYIADVGLLTWEEVNYEPPATPGRNYGWPCWEGLVRNEMSGPCLNPPPSEPPFVVYGHSTVVPPLNRTGCAVMGGEVYRGCAIPWLQGAYFVGDFCGRWIFSMRFDGTTLTDVVDRTVELTPAGATLDRIAGFGRDAFGEIYVCDLVDSQVFKILPVDGPVDCNTNGRADACDIAAGSSSDADGNCVPDECETLLGDLDGDGDVDIGDLAVLLSAYGTCLGDPAFTPAADIDDDGCIGLADLARLLANFGR